MTLTGVAEAILAIHHQAHLGMRVIRRHGHRVGHVVQDESGTPTFATFPPSRTKGRRRSPTLGNARGQRIEDVGRTVQVGCDSTWRNRSRALTYSILPVPSGLFPQVPLSVFTPSRPLGQALSPPS